jgi:hypothetical protein
VPIVLSDTDGCSNESVDVPIRLPISQLAKALSLLLLWVFKKN